MKFGIILPQDTEDPKVLMRAARLAEDAGLDSFWVVDNLQERPDPKVPFLESWTSLTAAASITSRIQIGTMVQRITLRNPAVAAAMAASLDRIAPGRLTLTLGVGDSTSKDEQNAFGIKFERKAPRFKKLEQTVTALREKVPTVPLWLGGESDETINHVGRFDAWNYWGPSAKFPERAERVRAAAGQELFPVTWSGPWRDFDMAFLQQAGAEHIVVATNTTIYEKRINMVKELMD
ncbi:MAG: LLM class flavin-dependent oxidoreductase [Actinomycetota bacterium]